MVASTLPRKVDVSSQILSKLDSATWKTLDSSVAASWRRELDEYIDQTKRRIHDCIASDAAAFHAQLRSARSTQERLRNLSHGVDNLNHAVFNPVVGITPVLLKALRQHQSLAQASLNADVIHASLLYLTKCKTQLESVRKSADIGDLPGAASACMELRSLLAAVPGPLGEARVTAVMKDQLRIIENRVFELLDDACSKSLIATEEQIIIYTSVLVPGCSTPLSLSSILSALSPSALSTHLTTLRRNLTTHYFDHMLQHSNSIFVCNEDDSSGRIIHTLQRHPLLQSASPDISLDILPFLLDFLNNKVFPHLPQIERDSFLRSLAKPLTTSILTHLLIPSLPSRMEALPGFLALTRKAVDFESKFIIDLLGGDSAAREIQAWTSSVCAHYEKARRVCILNTFREVMLVNATGPGDTFLAEISDAVHDKSNTIVLEQQDTTEHFRSSEVDAWNLDDDQICGSSPLKSAVDETRWSLNDEPEKPARNHAATTNQTTPGVDKEIDPGDAWGWNDEDLPEEAETRTSGDSEVTPSEEDGAWGDPWGDDAGADVSVTPYLPPRPESPKAVKLPAGTFDPERRANGHTTKTHHSPFEGHQGSSHVVKENYSVSTLTTEIIQTVEGCLREGKSLAASRVFSQSSSSASSPGDLIMHSGPLVLDLYCALYPVAAASRLTLPAPRMQFSNDCYYLSQELRRILEQAEDASDVMIKLQGCGDDLKVLADSWYYDGIEKQVAAMNDILADADGFTGTSDQDRYDDCEMGITTILRDIRKVAQGWKGILPKGKYYTAIGNIVDSVLARMIDDILAIPDITEAESHMLSELCRMLLALEGLFSDNVNESSFVVSFVPSWLKFSYLSELLEASMADLTYLFEEGALVDFEIDELAKLVHALFADTPLRAKTLDKIMAGHPIR